MCVCVCMCVYVCVYVCVCVCVVSLVEGYRQLVYLYLHYCITCTYVQTYTCMCMYRCTDVYEYRYIHLYTNTCIATYVFRIYIISYRNNDCGFIIYIYDIDTVPTQHLICYVYRCRVTVFIIHYILLRIYIIYIHYVSIQCTMYNVQCIYIYMYIYIIYNV